MSTNGTAPNVSANHRAALAYARELGWRVFPLRPRDKIPLAGSRGFLDATISAEQITAWWTRHPDANIGIATGAASGVVAVDVDGPEGEASLAALGPMPQCPTSSTGKGRHMYFAYAEGVGSSAGKLGEKLDVRGDGGYIVAPPSTHPSGARYAWQPGCHPLHITLPALPNAVVTRLSAPTTESVGGTTARAAALIPSGPIPEGERNASLAAYAGRFLAHGLNELETLDVIRSINLTKCTTPLPPDEVDGIVRSISSTHRRNKYQRNGAPDADGLREIVWRVLADVQSEAVRYYWRGRLPVAKLAVIQGDPGAGKSTVTMYMASRLSTGLPLYGEKTGAPACDVLVVSFEDSGADTLKPRAQAMGADMSRIHFVDMAAGGQLKIPADVEALRAKIKETSAGLLIIDPIGAAAGAGVDTHVDASVRGMLAPLAALAEETSCTILLVMHVGKGAKPAIHSALGSVAFTAAARVVLALGVAPDNPNERILATVKNNISMHAPSLRYALSTWTGIAEADGQPFEAPSIRWIGEDSATADELIAARNGAVEDRGAMDTACEFLTAALADGARPSKDLYREAARERISDSTLKRALKKLGGRVWREGTGADHQSKWELPTGSTPVKNPTPVNSAHIQKPDRSDESDRSDRSSDHEASTYEERLARGREPEYPCAGGCGHHFHLPDIMCGPCKNGAKTATVSATKPAQSQLPI